MVKHVKLFENWAEEDTSLPKWLDTNVHEIGGTKTLHHPYVIDLIHKASGGVLKLEYINFKSFSDYSFWNDEYKEIKVDQGLNDVKLQDCFGIPRFDTLMMIDVSIKSLKGLENHVCSNSLRIVTADLENLKYLPYYTHRLYLQEIPLLSLHIEKRQDLNYVAFASSITAHMCGIFTYSKAGYDRAALTNDLLSSPEFNAEIFCYFNNNYCPTGKSQIQIKPWNQIYEDPNEVENYDFLFVPFYLNSENFRTKAKEFIKNLDITSLDRSDLW